MTTLPLCDAQDVALPCPSLGLRADGQVDTATWTNLDPAKPHCGH
ncbi:hypothetical protein [Streptomyces sp. NPDC059761]